jgi:DNA-binding NarL/FixJ family response regulator
VSGGREPGDGAPEPGTTAGPGPDGRRPVRLAVLDDSDLFRETVLRLVARQRGLEPAATGAGPEDLDRVLATHPDVLCVDLNLSGALGTDLLPWIRTEHPEVRVVLLSGNLEPEFADRARAAGAAACMSKDQLLPLLRALAERGLDALGQ